MWILEIFPALLFILSSGLLFNDRFRHSSLMIGVAGVIAIVSSYLLFEQIVDRIVTQKLEQDRRNAAPPAIAAPVSPPAATPPPVPPAAPASSEAGSGPNECFVTESTIPGGLPSTCCPDGKGNYQCL